MGKAFHIDVRHQASVVKGVQTFTEFSGSGCAEVALQSVAHHLGLSGDAVKVGHAADIDPACRRVLLNSRLGFSFFSLFHMQMLQILQIGM